MNLTAADFDFIRTLVRQHSAIVIGDEKGYLADSRLLALAQREGMTSATELVTKLRSGNGNSLKQKVIEAMTTNETSFFRDTHPFEALRTSVLPALIKARETTRELRIWCAACSTGQEPYSVAMILREFFPQLQSWNVHILATDISKDVLQKASEGIYSPTEIGRGLPATYLAKYFVRRTDAWQLKDDLRRTVEFRYMNLAESWPPILKQDVIFLRNVLIYFDVATKKDILVRARKLLSADGALLLGGSESTLNLEAGFERVELSRTGIYRVRPN